MRTLVIKIVAAVFAAAVGAGLALYGAQLWLPSDDVLVTLIVAAALLAATSTIASAVSEYRRQRLGVRAAFAEALMTSTLWAVVDATGLDYRSLGLAAYRVERVWFAPWRSRLSRIHRVRAHFRPTASGVTWTLGKGVIGTAIARQQVVAQDLRTDYEALWPCSEDEWNTVAPPEARLGLSYAEFLDVRGKYDVVVAVPILESAAATTVVWGCVALDGPPGSVERLDDDDVLGLLEGLAQGLLHGKG